MRNLVVALGSVIAAGAFAAARLAAPDAETCSAIEARVDCGFLDIAPTECESRGCCYEKRTGSPSCYYPGEGVNTTKVHLLFSNHVDVGYTDYVDNVVNEYFHKYFPLAASVASELEAAGGPEQLKWLTQSWLVDLFFNCPTGPGTAAGVYNITCPTSEEKANIRDAIAKGYITWHAFPHNADMSLGTESMLRFGVNMTHALDDAFGLPRKTVVSQRDVPGFPRAAVPVLASEGVDVLSEGSNSAMNPPNVPPAFLWRDEASGKEAIVMWHALGYGKLPPKPSHSHQHADGAGAHHHAHVHADGTRHSHEGGASEHSHRGRRLHGAFSLAAKDYLRLPGMDEVLVYAWRDDNHGPPLTVAEVQADFEQVRGMFPGAEVVASTLEDFAAVLRRHKGAMPLVTGEIGDTWVMSAASDAKKMAESRALGRAVDGCIADGACGEGDESVVRFRKRHLKSIEHTLGLHVYAMGDRMTTDWSNEEFYAAYRAGDPNLHANPASWAKQKAWVVEAPLAEVPGDHPLLSRCQAELQKLEPRVPSPADQGFRRLTDLSARLSGLGPDGRVTVRFDPSTGALSELADAATGVVWANGTADGSSSIGLTRYQTLTEADWAAFREAYIFHTTDPNWAANTYGKPNMSSAHPEHQVVAPSMTELWERTDGDATSLLSRASFPASLNARYGAPTDVWTRIDIAGQPGAASVALNLTFTAVNKTATRLSEAAWVTFNPAPGASDGVPRAERPDRSAAAGPRRRALHAGPPSRRWDEQVHRDAAVSVHRARARARRATPPHLRSFQAPYHADAHYEWSSLPFVREAAGACEGCRLGRHRLPVHETDRSAYGPWSLRKLGWWQGATDGVEYGGRSLQAVTDLVRYAPQGVNGTLTVSSPDAGLVRWGPLSPFPLPMPGAPSENGGASLALWSNSLINTNVPFWQPWDAPDFRSDFQFRFGLELA